MPHAALHAAPVHHPTTSRHNAVSSTVLLPDVQLGVHVIVAFDSNKQILGCALHAGARSVVCLTPMAVVTASLPVDIKAVMLLLQSALWVTFTRHSMKHQASKPVPNVCLAS